MDKSERRQFRRIPVKFEINYVHEGDFLFSFTKDISVDGMFIYTEHPPSIGRIIQITFSLKDSDPIDLEAEVIWVNKTGDERDHGVGVQFINVSQEIKDIILAFINRVAVIEKEDITS